MFKITTKELIGKIEYSLKTNWITDGKTKSLSIYNTNYLNTETNQSGITRLIEFKDSTQSEKFYENILFPTGLDDKRDGIEIMHDFDITKDGLQLINEDYFTLQDWINIGERILINDKAIN